MAKKAEVTQGYDISQLSGTSLDTIQEQNDAIKTPSSKKREYLSIEDGKNKFRVFPAHPESDLDEDGRNIGRYAQARHQVWVKIKDRDGKIANRSFVNARIHAGQERDLVEVYHKIATDIIKNSSLNTKQKAQKLKNLSDFNLGIKHQGKFVAYAVNISKKSEDGDKPAEEGRRGLIEITYGIKKQLDKISLAEKEEDPTGACIVSDPNEGVVITINKDPNAANTEKYSVTQGRKPFAFAQEDVNWWIEEDSITALLFTDVNYHKGTIKQVLEGIENYDKTNKVGVADTDDFLDAYDELLALLPDAPVYDNDDSNDDEAEEVDTASARAEKPAKKERKRKAKVTLGEMSKAELKEFIMDNDLDVRVLKADSVEKVLAAIETETDLTPDDFPSDLVLEEEEEEENDNPLEDDDVKNDTTDEEEDDFEEEEEEEEEAPKRSRRTRRERG